MALASVALAEAQAHLNDVGATLWTDAVLLPFLKAAHRIMQQKLSLNGLPVLREASALITVTAGSVDLGTNQPTDLVEPKKMEERPSGSSDLFSAMDELTWELNITAVENLRYWTWREEKIVFPAATTNRQVRLYYIKGLTLPTSGAVEIGFINGENFLGPATAALAARSVGATSDYEELMELALGCLTDVIRRNVRALQSIPTKRRPYRYAMKMRRFF